MHATSQNTAALGYQYPLEAVLPGEFTMGVGDVIDGPQGKAFITRSRVFTEAARAE